jgi:hypothetical protein
MVQFISLVQGCICFLKNPQQSNILEFNGWGVCLLKSKAGHCFAMSCVSRLHF